MIARSIGARRIVEFGTSFGISTIYLAAALRDNGGGVVIGSEMQPSKLERARAHLAEAGLGDVAEIRGGDARETLRTRAARWTSCSSTARSSSTSRCSSS